MLPALAAAVVPADIPAAAAAAAVHPVPWLLSDMAATSAACLPAPSDAAGCCSDPGDTAKFWKGFSSLLLLKSWLLLLLFCC
jgi:hypothetical protein